MQRVVSFYEKLPRGPAPDVKAKGILGRYQAKHFGKNPSVTRRFYGYGVSAAATLLTWTSNHPRHHLPGCHRLRPELLLPPA